MFIYVHVTRLVFYGLLGVVAWLGELNWWIPVAWILWDNRWFVMIKIPFTTPKVPQIPFSWDSYKGPGPSNDDNGESLRH